MTRISFTAPPYGFHPLTEFELDLLPGTDGVYSLKCGDTRLFVMDAAVHLPKYQPVITSEQAAELALGDNEPSVFVVITPRDNGATVNLAAPIVVNNETGLCTQLILESDEWPIRAEL